MNRYVSVPLSMVNGEQIADEALLLAKQFSLELKISDSFEKIEIVSEPRVKKISFLDTFETGMIWSLDITDEFEIFDTSIILKIDNLTFQPKIQEKHVLKFRPRITTGGPKEVTVILNGLEYFKTILKEK